jgi:hypothetical protein
MERFSLTKNASRQHQAISYEKRSKKKPAEASFFAFPAIKAA